MRDIAGYEADPTEVKALVDDEAAIIAEAWGGDWLPTYVALTKAQVLFEAVAAELEQLRAATLARANDPDGEHGVSYQKIADATGLTRPWVQKLVERGRS